MEQQSGASGAAQAQAARTILPGEPFEPPAASQVPAPRDEAPVAAAEIPGFAPAEAPLAPPAWNYQPMGAPEGTPVYQAVPDAYAQPQPMDGDFNTLHDFASLPVAPQFGAPADTFAPASFPPPPADAPTFAPAPPAAFAPAEPVAGFPPPVFAPAVDDSLPPLPPPQDDEGLFAEPEKGKKDRKPVDKRLLAGALVVVLAGGGYFGYTQLSKKSSTTSSGPVTPVTAPAPKYDFPSNIAGLKLQPAASSAALKADVLAEAKTWNPAVAKTMSFASYSAGKPSIIALSFHPAQSKLTADFASLVKFSATPATGDVETGVHIAVPGAAGGQMTCGGERGANAQSWCVWRGASTIGVMAVDGSPKSQITEILTREMRAFAEH